MNRRNQWICTVTVVIGIVTGITSGGTVLYGAKAGQPVGGVVIAGQALGMLRISPKGLALIGNAEGCRTHPYRCPAGKLTNGIGNTANVPAHDVSLPAIAKDWVKNIQRAEHCVIATEKAAGQPMTQGQFDALTSFVFNTGCPRFQRNRDNSMTRIYRLARAGKYVDACRELPRWVYGGGQKLPGLVTRRGKEYARCMAVD
jgi:lysozyme